ncbi:MAG: TolC family outer membrane protein [Cognatishimia sp.]|uniref:TolC family outer membrane protein n=1 Tax=Cognatishimia sp. TaxID=2211648 RepID=UPI003B8DFED1
MSIKHAVLSLAVVFTSMGTVTASKADTLADAMAGAYVHSGLIEQNRALLRVADENVAQAASSLRPIISWSADLNRRISQQTGVSTSVTDTATAALSLSWTVYDGGARAFGKERLKQTVLATRQTLVSVEQNVLLAAVRAYMDVRRESEIVSLRQNNLRVITRELRAAEDRFDVGEVTRTDVALAQARLAGARAELAVAQGNLLAAQASYSAAVGEKPHNLVAPSRLPRLSKSADTAMAYAVRNHPDMLKVQFDVAAADWGVREADASISPSISLSGSINQSNTLGTGSDTLTSTIGIGAGGPIYSGGRIASVSRQAIARRDAVRAGLHATRHSVRQNVSVAWSQLLSARAQREASRRQISASRTAFEGVREEAKLGARTTLDVLNAEQELLDAQANQISAQSAEFIAAYSLQAAMGLLTVDHLNLVVEKYDPEAYYNQVNTAPAKLSKRGRQLDKILRRIENQ